MKKKKVGRDRYFYSRVGPQRMEWNEGLEMAFGINDLNRLYQSAICIGSARDAWRFVALRCIVRRLSVRMQNGAEPKPCADAALYARHVA